MLAISRGIDDAELASRVFDRLACRPAQMPSEMASIKRADCCQSDASHDDNKNFLMFLKGLDYDCKNHCISIDHGD